MTTTLTVSVNGSYQRQVLIKGVAETVGPNESRSFGLEGGIMDVKFTAEELVSPITRDLAQERINETRDETHPMGATISRQEADEIEAREREEAERLRLANEAAGGDAVLDTAGETTLTVDEQIEAEAKRQQAEIDAQSGDF